MADQDYLVTARKYRPSLFKELVAQTHVSETLKNAIRRDRLAHAYLFSGPRGVGKTTAARILAKAINCETPRDEREDGAEPCRECDSCVSFEEGRSLNVFEMDAASNNKVDDVRELREKVRIPPQGEKKKVYILDEVHMLSKSAFNALLKTLEEPPAHALFIFATTEPHKVLPTILSRCQRFDFRRIPVPQIVDRLRDICEAEGVEADEESLMLLARKGNGALRDALSAFDQAISLCGTTLAYGELTQALGVVDQDRFFELTDHVARQDTAGVLTLVREVVRSGYDLQEFLAGLAEHLRNLLVTHSLGEEAVEEVAESTRAQYAEEASRFGEADLLRLLTLAGDAEDEIKNSPQPRLKLETTLLKMAQMRRTADLNAVLDKIERLEERAEEGTIPGPESSAQEGSSAEETNDSSSTASSPAGAGQEVPDAGTGPVSPDDGGDPPDGASPPSPDTSEERADDGEPAAAPATASQEEAQPDATDEGAPRGTADDPEDRDDPPGPTDPGVEYNDLFGPPALEEGPDADPEDGTTDAAGGEQTSNGPETGEGPKATVAEPAPPSKETTGIAQAWPEFVQSIKHNHIRLGTFLGEAEPVEWTDAVLTLSVPRALHRDTLRDQRRVLLEHLTTTLDTEVREVQFVVDDTPDAGEESTAAAEPASPREKLEALRETYPALDVLFGEFGAEPVW